MNPKLQKSLRSGIDALRRADFPEAIERLGEVVVEDPAHAEAWRQLGVCYLETAQPDLAIEALSRAIRAEPENPRTHYLLGNAYGASGKLESAAACYRQALKLSPSDTKAEEFLIRTESLLESREHYRSGLKVLYGGSASPADLNEALRGFVRSIAIFDGSPARDHLLDCARRVLARKTDVSVPVPAAPELYTWAAACERGYQCIQFNNWVGVRAAYDEALSYRARDAFVHHALGFAFTELGELNDAVRAWLRVLELECEYDFTQFGRVAWAQPGMRRVISN